jgi:hypothetical protein
MRLTGIVVFLRDERLILKLSEQQVGLLAYLSLWHDESAFCHRRMTAALQSEIPTVAQTKTPLTRGNGTTAFMLGLEVGYVGRKPSIDR